MLNIMHIKDGALDTFASKAIFHISCSQCLSQTLLLLSGIPDSVTILCEVVAAVQHLLWICTFLIMSIFSVFLAGIFILLSMFQIEEKRSFWPYCLTSWLVAMAVVTICLSFQCGYNVPVYCLSIVSGNCWFISDDFFLWSFVVPTAILLRMNLSCFLICLTKCIKIRSTIFMMTESATRKKKISKSVWSLHVWWVYLGCWDSCLLYQITWFLWGVYQLLLHPFKDSSWHLLLF